MSKNDTNISMAEQYRKERKQRIAKNAKKAAKKNGSGNSGSSEILAKIITTVFAVVVVGFVSYLLLNNFGVFERMIPACEVGGTTISKAEYTYQIRSTYTQLCTMADQYAQYYGSNILGFDTSKTPEDQKYTADDEAPTDEEAAKDYEGDKYDTWMDYIVDQAIVGIQERIALCAEAKEAGFELSEEDLKEIDDAIDELEKNVLESSTETNPISLKGYIKNTYGNGMTLKMFKNLQIETTLAQKYQEHKKEELKDSYAESDIKAAYDKDKATYDVVDYRSYTIAFSDKKDDTNKTLTKAEAKKRADDFVAAITDEKSFNKLADKYAKADDEKSTTYEDADATLTKGATGANFESMDEKGTVKKWVYADGRKAGDVKAFELASSFVIVYVVTPAHETYAYDSRHILVKFDGETDETTGETATPKDSDWKALKAEADKIYKEWKSGEATEDSFAALADKYSDDGRDEDGNLNTPGGLYEDTAPGQFVESYEKWCLAPERKAGDVGIVKEDGSYQGYHIIYFKGLNDKPVWDDTIRTEKANEDYDEYHTDIIDNKYQYSVKDSVIKDCRKDASDFFRAYVAQSAASSYSY